MLFVNENYFKAKKGLMARLGELFFAHGGIVPRDGFAVGGSKDPSLPYEEDDKTPYKYFHLRRPAFQCLHLICTGMV